MENRIALAVASAGGGVLLLWGTHLLLPDSGLTAGWLLWSVAALFLVVLTLRLRRRVLGPVQSLANILEAIRYEDYGLRWPTRCTLATW